MEYYTAETQGLILQSAATLMQLGDVLSKTRRGRGQVDLIICSLQRIDNMEQ